MIGLRPLERAAARGLARLPKGLLTRLAGAPDVVDGQTLDPMVKVILRVQALRRRPPMESLDPASARKEYADSLGILDEPQRPMLRVEDVDADGVPVRIYEPRAPDGVRGLLVYLHGGGGVIGDVDCCDAPVRLLADEASVAVASVDYRLAPEHPFPAALEDTHTAFTWARREAERFGARPDKVAVGGDSYGATLATLLALDRRGAEGPAAQLLIYPCCDFLREGGSRDLFAQGYLLDRPLIEWFRAHAFTSGEDRARASALRAEDVAGVAPALIYTAGFDPLRDEGKDYADRLTEAGIQTFYRCETSLLHAFISMTGVVPAAHVAVIDMAHRLKAALSASA